MNRQDFYRSKSWYQCKGSYIKSVDYLCERCGRVAHSKGDRAYKEGKKNGQDVVFGIVHHKIHLNESNINDPYIALNHDNLEYLCIDCHNKEHFGKQTVREGLSFDSKGNVIYNG